MRIFLLGIVTGFLVSACTPASSSTTHHKESRAGKEITDEDIDAMIAQRRERKSEDNEKQAKKADSIHDEPLLKQADSLTPESQLIALVEEALSSLKYYWQIPQGKPSPELVTAIKSFQKRIGAPVTGILTVREGKTLFEAHQMTTYPKILVRIHPLPEHNFTLSRNGDTFEVTGAWIWEEADINGPNGPAFPISLTTLRCLKLTRQCLYFNSFLDEKPGKDDPALQHYIDTFNVKEWTPRRIVAQAEARCRINTIIMSPFTGKTVQIHTMPENQYAVASCPPIPGGKREIHLGGWHDAYDALSKVYRHFFQKRMKYMNPEYLSRMKQALLQPKEEK